MSWKTTLFGIGTILAAVGSALKAAFDGDPSTHVDVAMLAVGITTGLGLIMAKDSKTASK